MTKLSKSQILKGTALPVAARSLEIFGEFFPASKNGAMRMKPVASTFLVSFPTRTNPGKPSMPSSPVSLLRNALCELRQSLSRRSSAYVRDQCSSQ
jgi:hypothetical protein